MILRTSFEKLNLAKKFERVSQWHYIKLKIGHAWPFHCGTGSFFHGRKFTKYFDFVIRSQRSNHFHHHEISFILTNSAHLIFLIWRCVHLISANVSQYIKCLCPIHILAIGPTIADDLNFHDRPRFTVPCDCKFRYKIYYDSTTTYWPRKPWLRITKINKDLPWSIFFNHRHSLSIVINCRHSQPPAAIRNVS